MSCVTASPFVGIEIQFKSIYHNLLHLDIITIYQPQHINETPATLVFVANSLFKFNVLVLEKLVRSHNSIISEIKVLLITRQDIIGIGINS